MRQIILLATTFTLLLVGCAPLVEQRQQEVFKQAQAISAECHEKRLSAQLKGFADAARCSNDRMRQIQAEAGFPYMDLVDLMAADRLAVAERMDKGEMSIAEANVQIAELGVRVINEAQRRDAEARQTQFQGQQVQQAAWQNSLNMLNENLQQDRAVRTAPRPIAPVTCQNFGSMVRCY